MRAFTLTRASADTGEREAFSAANLAIIGQVALVPHEHHRHPVLVLDTQELSRQLKRRRDDGRQTWSRMALASSKDWRDVTE